MASNPNDHEDACLDGSDRTSLLAVDKTTQNKTTKVMTEADSGVNYVLVKVKSGITLDAGDIQIGAVEIKDATSTNRMIVDASGHAQIDIAASSVNLDIGDISKGTQTNDIKVTLDSEVVEVKADDENQRILDADDTVTTVNYADSNKDSVSNIVTSSAGLSRKVTDTYNNTGGTTLTITRAVADV